MDVNHSKYCIFLQQYGTKHVVVLELQLVVLKLNWQVGRKVSFVKI